MNKTDRYVILTGSSLARKVGIINAISFNVAAKMQAATRESRNRRDLYTKKFFIPQLVWYYPMFLASHFFAVGRSWLI